MNTIQLRKDQKILKNMIEHFQDNGPSDFVSDGVRTKITRSLYNGYLEQYYKNDQDLNYLAKGTYIQIR